MAVIGAEAITLSDWAKRVDPGTNSVTTNIVEMLEQTNDILEDMLWKEGNLPTGHRLTVRTGLPAVAWRRLNAGTPTSKSTTAQIDEACGMLNSIGQVDKDIAELNGNTVAFRASENVAFIQAMNIEFARTLFYGDSFASPEQFLGLAPRYSTIANAVNGQNILSAGTVTGGDGTSIWLIGWGDKSIHGIFPKGSKAGLQVYPSKGYEWLRDAAGNEFLGYKDAYEWKCGLALPDWRYVVRIANIDTSALIADDSGSTVKIINLMARAIDRLPTQKGIRPVFYMNRTVHSGLKIQAMNKSVNALALEQGHGQFKLNFLGIPVRHCDAILNTEGQIS